MSYQAARFERVNPEQNEQRFYLVELRRTLFGSPAVVATWGRIGSEGQQSVRWCDSPGEAKRVFDRAQARRIAQGYKHNMSSLKTTL